MFEAEEPAQLEFAAHQRDELFGGAARIVDLFAFKNRNFALGTAYTFVIGTGLYGATYLLPLFLAEVRGYNSLQIGLTVFVTGATQMVVSPLTNFLARKMDLRLMLALGMALFVLAMVLNATMTDETGFDQLLLPQAVRGVALMFCLIPATLGEARSGFSPDWSSAKLSP